MIIIFAGPSITEQQICNVLPEATVMPPAAAGDVYHAVQSLPDAIGIIDGYFDSVPSVWHKEILHALSVGISVFGASSMGALRAAELYSFGMIGVGKIFESFRDGALEDDDEVALQHGPNELGFVPLSEAMVNIRATIEHATEDKVIEKHLASKLIDLAKNRFYPERTWDNLVADGLKTDISGEVINKLVNWLPGGRVDQKHLDAIELLNEIKNCRPEEHRLSNTEFNFQHTVMWDQLKTRIDSNRKPTHLSVVLDCLRCEPNKYQCFRRLAVKNMLTNLELNTGNSIASKADVVRAMTEFRTQNKLYTAASLNDWLSANGLDPEKLEERLIEELSATELIKTHPNEFGKAILNELKSANCYSGLSSKADAILHIMEEREMSAIDLHELGLNSIELQLWYFETCINTPMPDNLDQYLEKMDFLNRQVFEKMMICQFILWENRQNSKQR